MKYTTVIDPNGEEKVIIYVHRRTKEIETLEAYIDQMGKELLGYGADGHIVPLHPAEAHCYTVEEGKVYALTDRERLAVRLPLYAIEEMLDESFVRINQSCIANIRKIDRFRASRGGSLQVVFQNGYTDYVSRRQLKTVKERMGIKK